MAVQADTGSSLAEAARHIDRLRLQLSTLESMSGSVERSILTRYEDGSTDIDENEVPLLTKALRILSESTINSMQNFYASESRNFSRSSQVQQGTTVETGKVMSKRRTFHFQKSSSTKYMARTRVEVRMCDKR